LFIKLSEGRFYRDHDLLNSAGRLLGEETGRTYVVRTANLQV